MYGFNRTLQKIEWLLYHDISKTAIDADRNLDKKQVAFSTWMAKNVRVKILSDQLNNKIHPAFKANYSGDK